jgi:hypothetical protein
MRILDRRPNLAFRRGQVMTPLKHDGASNGGVHLSSSLSRHFSELVKDHFTGGGETTAWRKAEAADRARKAPRPRRR